MNDKTQERAKIIMALRCCGYTDTKRPDCDHCPLNGYMCVKRMLEGAAALLERDEPPNNPLTLEELRGMGGEPYYHISLQGSGDHWEVMDTLIARNIQDYHYGERWLAYRRKPEGGGE